MTTSLSYVDVACRTEPRPGRKIGGYASVFGQTTDLGWLGKEEIARSAFEAALLDPATDVRALWNHDSNLLLGRQGARTLRMGTDSTGLEYEVDLPDTTYARDLLALVERGDLATASFAFVPGETTNRGDVVVHTSVRRLVDVSPVTFPAYAGASTEARSADQLAADRRRDQLIRVRHRAARIALGRGADR